MKDIGTSLRVRRCSVGVVQGLVEKHGYVLNFGESEPFFENSWGHSVADSRVSLLLEQLGEVRCTSPGQHE